MARIIRAQSLSPSRATIALLSLALTFPLAAAWTARGDEPPKKDEALDRLLEKIEETTPTPAPQPKDDSDAKAKSEPAKPEAKPEAKPDDATPADTKKLEASRDAGKVAPKDEALDSLLEKLGETQDRPDTLDERRGGPGMPGKDQEKGEGAGGDKAKDDEPKPPGTKPDQPAPDELTGRDKTIDERLEELTGRKRKKKDQDGDGDGGGSGPLSKVIKEMREVEQRLGKPDTGEETRKKQTEIVKNLDQIIERLRATTSQSQGKKSTRQANMPGQQPGSQPGQQPGANPGGAPNTKPAKPESRRAFAGGKDVWGHLPPELRQEADNIAQEVMLPSKEELIRLYYLSVSKKSLAREK